MANIQQYVWDNTVDNQQDSLTEAISRARCQEISIFGTQITTKYINTHADWFMTPRELKAKP